MYLRLSSCQKIGINSKLFYCKTEAKCHKISLHSILYNIDEVSCRLIILIHTDTSEKKYDKKQCAIATITLNRFTIKQPIEIKCNTF